MSNFNPLRNLPCRPGMYWMRRVDECSWSRIAIVSGSSPFLKMHVFDPFEPDTAPRKLDDVASIYFFGEEIVTPRPLSAKESFEIQKGSHRG